jgi:PAS domain S-box-containing protein
MPSLPVTGFPITAADRDRIWAHSRDLLLVLSSDRIVLAASRSSVAVLGYQPEELVGRSLDDFLWPEGRASPHEPTGSDPVGYENRYRHRDGTPRWISLHEASDGALIYASGRDVTDEKHSALQLRDAQQALRQSQKLEAIGQLTGGVAHDFNNLLQVIATGVQLLRKPELPRERRMRAVDAIEEAAARGNKLTNQLLAFTRRQVLEPTRFDIVPNTQLTCDMINTLIGSTIAMETELPDEPCYVCADQNQFDTALLNLAVNARDAMTGSGTVTIAIRPASEIPAVRSHPVRHGDFVAVSVADTGCGMERERLGRIFEPFFTTKDVGHGTGLGLSQVFGFAKQSGGEIQVESVPGKGSRFTLFLPRDGTGLASGDAASPDANTYAPDPEVLRQLELDSMRILDTEAELLFDDLTRLAADFCDSPIALISLIDNDRQWFKSRFGLEANQTPREHAFCAHAIESPGEVMIVEDAARDERFAGNPLVTGDPNIRFYAGAPLVTDSGHALGTLCVIGPKPRRIDPQQVEMLRFLARRVVDNMVARRRALETAGAR